MYTLHCRPKKLHAIASAEPHWPAPVSVVSRATFSFLLKSAWMLYHLVGMSFSSRTNFVWLSWLDLVAIIGLLRISIRRDPWESALTIRKGDWPCQYTSLLDSCRRSGCHGPNATPAAHRRDPDAVPPDRPGSGAGTGRADQKPHRVCGGARRRRSPGRHQPHAGSGPRLGGDARLSALHLVAGPRRRRGDGHLAARDGIRLAHGEGADPARRRGGTEPPRRRDRERRGHRPPRARAPRGARRRRGGVRGAVRVHRVGGGPDHPDGEPRARRVREEPGRLREGLRPPPGPGEGARDHPLARRHVRPRARRLLGLARHGPRDRDAARDRARPRAEDRRRQDLAPRSGARDRDAAAVP